MDAHRSSQIQFPAGNHLKQDLNKSLDCESVYAICSTTVKKIAGPYLDTEYHSPVDIHFDGYFSNCQYHNTFQGPSQDHLWYRHYLTLFLYHRLSYYSDII